MEMWFDQLQGSFHNAVSPHCHPIPKGLWLCRSVYSPAAQISSYMFGGRSRQSKKVLWVALSIVVVTVPKHQLEEPCDVND